MDISILCSDAEHPVNEYLQRWIDVNSAAHEISLVRHKADLNGGDLLFLISCSEIIRFEDRDAFKKCLVLHASALPKGRGWSPHVWEIISGATTLTLSLLEAEDQVDSGKLWIQREFQIAPDALWDEINDVLFRTELQLMDFAVKQFGALEVKAQNSSVEPTYYRKRNAEDSRVDPSRSIESQFDMIRVCDPKRFPAYFELRGCRYKITLEKVSGKPNSD